MRTMLERFGWYPRHNVLAFLAPHLALGAARDVRARTTAERHLGCVFLESSRSMKRGRWRAAGTSLLALVLAPLALLTPSASAVGSARFLQCDEGGDRKGAPAETTMLTWRLGTSAGTSPLSSGEATLG